jgi:putative phosphoribosyl transferase
MLFIDRNHAGELLAERLTPYRNTNPLILAVPRGGVAVAKPVWEKIGGVLDLIITRKIGAPQQPELAIGAVTGDGFLMLNDKLVQQLGISRAYIERAAEAERAEIERRLVLYRGKRPLFELNARTVLLIDDGVATGFTIKAALRAIRQHKPAELVLAVPVGPPEALYGLRAEVEQLYCLESPLYFSTVGQFYRDFTQVSDAEVIDILERSHLGEA